MPARWGGQIWDMRTNAQIPAHLKGNPVKPSSDLRPDRNFKRVVAVLTLSAAAFFPGAASAHASTQIGAAGSIRPDVYAAYGLNGPVTISSSRQLSAVYAGYGLHGPVTLLPEATSTASYLAYGLEGPVESTSQAA